MATLTLKSSRNKQQVVIVFFVNKKYMQIKSTLKCIQYMTTSALRSKLFTFGVKMLGGQKFVSYTEVQSVVLHWHGQQLASLFASGNQKFADR